MRPGEGKTRSSPKYVTQSAPGQARVGVEEKWYKCTSSDHLKVKAAPGGKTGQS